MKTLKDLKERIYDSPYGDLISKDELREVAREYIKWMNSDNAWNDIPVEDKVTEARIARGLAPILYNKTAIEYFINYFFNLEDE